MELLPCCYDVDKSDAALEELPCSSGRPVPQELVVFLPPEECFPLPQTSPAMTLRLPWHGPCEGLQAPRVLTPAWDLPLATASLTGTTDQAGSPVGLDLEKQSHPPSKMAAF